MKREKTSEKDSNIASSLLPSPAAQQMRMSHANPAHKRADNLSTCLTENCDPPRIQVNSVKENQGSVRFPSVHNTSLPVCRSLGSEFLGWQIGKRRNSKCSRILNPKCASFTFVVLRVSDWNYSIHSHFLICTLWLLHLVAVFRFCEYFYSCNFIHSSIVRALCMHVIQDLLGIYPPLLAKKRLRNTPGKRSWHADEADSGSRVSFASF